MLMNVITHQQPSKIYSSHLFPRMYHILVLITHEMQHAFQISHQYIIKVPLDHGINLSYSFRRNNGFKTLK